MSYIGAEPDGQGKAQRFTFTASGGETVVTADDDGIPIGYTAGQVSVYLNGVKLVVGTGKDCQATNGSTITGLAALAASDVVEIVALSTFDATTVEGTALISTGETGGTKFLREDGDGTSSWQTVTEYNDDVIQTNIALLAFKTATNGSLAKYNLQDQVIDEYTDATGVDDTPSNNHTLASGAYSGMSAEAVGGTKTNYGSYSVHTFLLEQTGDSFTPASSLAVEYIVIGGGGSGANTGGVGTGGGGAGGFRFSNSTFAAQAYTITVGAGGAEHANDGLVSSIAGSGFTTFSASGGGAAGASGAGGGGGSGGGAGYSGAGGVGNGGGYSPVEGYAGGTGQNAGNGEAGGGGGGAGGVGGNGTAQSQGATGGIGSKVALGMTDANTTLLYASAGIGEIVGGYRYVAGGGGGGINTNYPHGPGGSGGGGNGGGSGGGDSGAGLDGAGGGGGGGGYSTSLENGKAGGSGVVIIRYTTPINDLTLQSTDTEAEAQPTKADMVMLIEDAGSGVATLGTHIKGFISRDSGTTFTEGTLVDEGDWGTDKRILAFHDLDISGQPADQTMCYKITTHSASAVYNTKIHATSIGWR